jgi:hypothetical protein
VKRLDNVDMTDSLILTVGMVELVIKAHLLINISCRLVYCGSLKVGLQSTATGWIRLQKQCFIQYDMISAVGHAGIRHCDGGDLEQSRYDEEKMFYLRRNQTHHQSGRLYRPPCVEYRFLGRFTKTP